MLKAFIQKVITYLPYSFKINYLFQRYVTKAVLLSDEFFDIMLEHYAELCVYAEKHNKPINGSKILELGTGWHPIMSVLFYLSGANEIITLDLRSLLSKKNIEILLKKVINYHNSNKFTSYNIEIQPKRMEALKDIVNEIDQYSISDLLSKINTKQKIEDARSVDYPDHYFDICFSVNVYEHVHLDVLPKITREFFRVCKRNGLSVSRNRCL